MARRDLMRVMRQPEALTFSLIMGIFFLLLFYYVFGGVIEAGTGIDYIQFLVPGVLVITALNGSTQTGSGLALDLSEGVTDRFRSLPMSQLSVLAGRTIADGVRNFVGLVLLAAFGYLLGFRFDNLAGGIGAVLIAALIGYAFSWISAAIGAKVQNAEMVSMLTMFWLFPLMFASNVFTPTDAMPSWLKAFADNQPISVATEAVRALSAGTDAAESVMLTIVWSIGLVVVFAALAVRSYRRAN
jgi:ABC-2 type transport system permease protein/oleandomycin transport system permease protein